MKFIPNTLKGKISLIYVSLVLLIALVGLSGFFNLYRLEKSVDNLMTDNYKSINATAKMLEALERQDGAVLTSISVDYGKGMDAFMREHAVFIEWYHVEVNNVTEQGEKKLIEDIGSRYDEYVKTFSALKGIQTGKNEDEDLLSYNQTMIPLFNQIKSDLSEISHLNETAMFRSKADASIKTRSSMYFLLGLSFLAVLLGYVASRHLVNRFLNPLNQLTDRISKVKAGELNQQLELHTNDETGKLAREFNSMTQRLQNYERSTLGQLMTEKNKSVAIVKSISDPLLVLDADYRVVLVNDACENFFNIVEEKIVGKHFLEAIHYGNIFDHITTSVLTDAEPHEKIFQLRLELDYYFNVVVVPVKDIESNNTELIVVFQNVTELKELERIKTDFIATISHEFKTPLTSIIMAASMLTNPNLGGLSSEQKEIMDAIREDGERLTNLVNELLELSRIESDSAVYQFETCSIKSIIDTSIKGFTDTAARRGIRIDTDAAEELPNVPADFKKISWVLNNLISNALKYTKSGDSVTVSARDDIDKIRISVLDTGLGILPEYIDHVFDKFYQVKDRDIEVRGTGLGLYIAREIVNAHSGEIWVESQPNHGSTFTFTLPKERPVS